MARPGEGARGFCLRAAVEAGEAASGRQEGEWIWPGCTNPAGTRGQTRGIDHKPSNGAALRGVQGDGDKAGTERGQRGQTLILPVFLG